MSESQPPPRPTVHAAGRAVATRTQPEFLRPLPIRQRGRDGETGLDDGWEGERGEGLGGRGKARRLGELEGSIMIHAMAPAEGLSSSADAIERESDCPSDSDRDWEAPVKVIFVLFPE